MPIGDVSRFSKVDAAVWSALKDTTAAVGVTLDSWRKEQSPNGNWRGKDFDSGEIPKLEDIPIRDCPALLVVSPAALASDLIGADFENVLYPKLVLGVLQATKNEATLDQKIKRFGELVWSVLAYWRASNFTNFVAVPNPISQMHFGTIEFPNFEKAGLVAFGITLGFVIDLPVR